MIDLKNPRLMWLKGILFLLIGITSAALLVHETPTWRVGGLLALTIWTFCRAYNFAFYVIEHYSDPSYRFAGLISFVRCIASKRRHR